MHHLARHACLRLRSASWDHELHEDCAKDCAMDAANADPPACSSEKNGLRDFFWDGQRAACSVRAIVGMSGGGAPNGRVSLPQWSGHVPAPFPCFRRVARAISSASKRDWSSGPFRSRTHLSATPNFHIKSSGFLHGSQDFYDSNQP